ncbi:MAG TPA: hypothetical protein VLE94_13960 [Burkholderiaceae bacterium]|nr:hypothetical protein [Burkholderiaceae bacterium]HSC01191.1 hypothetical protein [Burkholderiaceae bacterium]
MPRPLPSHCTRHATFTIERGRCSLRNRSDTVAAAQCATSQPSIHDRKLIIMNQQTPIAVRAIAAAFAVFMTVAMLNSVFSIAEPQRSQLVAANAAHQAERIASAPGQRLAQAATGTTNR